LLVICGEYATLRSGPLHFALHFRALIELTSMNVRRCCRSNLRVTINDIVMPRHCNHAAAFVARAFTSVARNITLPIDYRLNSSITMTPSCQTYAWPSLRIVRRSYDVIRRIHAGTPRTQRLDAVDFLSTLFASQSMVSRRPTLLDSVFLQP
jgi:hypothetical protein